MSLLQILRIRNPAYFASGSGHNSPHNRVYELFMFIKNRYWVQKVENVKKLKTIAISAVTLCTGFLEILSNLLTYITAF